MAALLDTNVAIASIVDTHIHHRDSFDAIAEAAPGEFAVAAHVFSETYSTLTRAGPRGFGYEPAAAFSAIESLNAATSLLGLTDVQTFESIGSYAGMSGVGPRLYDFLIGQVARVHGIQAIVTWNVGHMQTLFPDLDVLTPREFLRRPRP